MLPDLITYPARPVNGGRLEDAPPKVGPWVYQPKIKDWRAVVHAPTKRIWNRHGEPMSIEADLQTPLSILHCMPFEWLDVGVMDRQNQLLRGSIVVFDWIPVSHPPSEFQPEQSIRRNFLVREFEVLPNARNLHLFRPADLRQRVFLVPEYPTAMYVTSADALEILNDLRRQNAALGGNPADPHDMKNFYEGIVAKRTDKPYPIQLLSPTKETPWMMKHRFDQ